MRFLSLLALLGPLSCSFVFAADDGSLKAGNYEFVFATVEQGRDVLGTRDTFASLMSPFDRKVRMQTADDAGQKAYLKFAAGEVIAWTPAGRAAMTAAVKAMDESMKSMTLPSLKPILLIHTSGKEEGGAPYTRGNAIVVPSGAAGTADRPAVKMLAHEVFHVISRNHPKLRDELYSRIGFRNVGTVRFSDELANLRITNPDAPAIEHVIDVKIDADTEASVAPVTFAKRAYDHGSKMSLFGYLNFQLIEVEENAKKQFVAKEVAGKPLTHSPMPDYFRQIGRNTQYIIHPEEILADNFSLKVNGKGRVSDQWVIDAVTEVLASSETP